MFWFVRWVTSGAVFDIEIMDVSINYQTKGLDVAKCKSATQVPVENLVEVYNSEGEKVFKGYVKKNKMSGKDKNGDDIFELEIHESATELTMQRMGQVENGYIVSQKVYMPSVSLKEAVISILNGSGWQVHPSWVYPSPPERTPMLMFYYTTRFDALYKLVRAMYGYDLWFSDDGTGKKYVYYGPGRYSWGTIDALVLDSSSEYDSRRRKVDFVKIIGKSDSISGQWPQGGMAVTSKIAVFRYDDIMNNDEATRLAKQVFSDIGTESVKVTVNLNRPISYIREADQVSISGLSYIVKDVVYNEKETILKLSTGELSIFDLLDEKLKEVTGEIKEGSIGTYDGGWQNVSSEVNSSGQYIGAGKWMLQIQDVNLVRDFELNITLDRFRKDLATQLSPAEVKDLSLPTNIDIGIDKALVTTNPSPTWIDPHIMPAGTKGRYTVTGLGIHQTSEVADAGRKTEHNSFNYLTGGYDFTINTVSTDGFFGDSGFQFALIVHTATITPVSDCTISWVVYWNGQQDTNPINLYFKAGHSYAISLPFLVKGRLVSRSNGYQLKIRSSADCGYENSATMITALSRHSHTYVEPNNGWGHDTVHEEPNGRGHDTNITDPTHVNPANDPGHPTNYVDPTHGHPNTEPNNGKGHPTGEKDGTKEIDLWPGDVIIGVYKNVGTPQEVLVYRSGVYPGPAQGGSSKITMDLQPYLATGTMRIVVWSTQNNSAGSVYVGGTYTNYGVGV